MTYMHFLKNSYCLLDSGHGGQTKDLDGDEADRFDEGEEHQCIVMVIVIYPVSCSTIPT
jgi:hypothetical protein